MKSQVHSFGLLIQGNSYALDTFCLKNNPVTDILAADKIFPFLSELISVQVLIVIQVSILKRKYVRSKKEKLIISANSHPSRGSEESSREGE